MFIIAVFISVCKLFPKIFPCFLLFLSVFDKMRLNGIKSTSEPRFSPLNPNKTTLIYFQISLTLTLSSVKIYIVEKTRARSSAGQSRRLITAWSGVRIPPGPPSFCFLTLNPLQKISEAGFLLFVLRILILAFTASALYSFSLPQNHATGCNVCCAACAGLWLQFDGCVHG